jgi:5-hydroxyisourate hydrolase-like protein (transthyretin family)
MSRQKRNRKTDIIRKLFLVVTIPLLILMLSPLLSSSAHAASATTGHISGRLLDGSNKNAPLAGQEVTLQMAQGQNSQDLKKIKTDAQGSYTFDNLATDKTMSYAVYIRYQGAHYVTDVVTLDSKPTQQIDLTVYQATKDPARIFVGRVTVLVHEPNLERKTVTISEIYSVSNLDTRSYVGSLDGSKGKPNALRFSLPEGAGQITLDKGFDGYQVIQVDRGFASDAAVLPGDNEFGFSYEVPYSSTTLALQYTTIYPTLDYSFMVPTDIHFSADGLKAAGTVNSGNDQRPYSLYQATQLPANQEIKAQLEGLLLPDATAPLAVKPQFIWLLVSIALMLAILGFTWYYMRSLKREQKEKAATRSAKKPLSPPVKAAKPARKKTSVEEREQELLQELLELDQDYEAGKLEKPVYQDQRKKAKASLRALLREKEVAGK